MTPTELRELEEQIKAKRDALQAVVTPPEGAEPVEHPAEAMKALGDEIRDLVGKRKAAAEEAKAKDLLSWLDDVDPAQRKAIEDAAEQDGANAAKSIGERFTESDAFKQYHYGGVSTDMVFDISLSNARAGNMGGDTPQEKAIKALLSTTAGFESIALRLPNIVGPIYRPRQFLDMVRQVPLAANDTFEWMEQTVRTDPATWGSTAEGAVYREAAAQWTKRSASAVLVTAWIPVTEIQLQDVPFVQDAVNSQLPMQLGEIIDHQIINGPGGTDRIIGLTAQTNRTQRTKGADESTYNVIAQAMGDVWITGRAMPSHILIHTLDYLDMMLEQTRDGNYLFGMLNQMGQSPWGVEVVKYDAVPRGTYIVGDFDRYYMLRDRQQMRTRMAPRWAVTGSTPADDGTNPNALENGLTAPTGQVMIYSDCRVQSQWLRPQAFTHITS